MMSSALAVEVPILCECGRTARTLYASARDWASSAPLTSLRANVGEHLELAGESSEDERYRVRCPAKRCVAGRGAERVLRGDTILSAVEAKRRSRNVRRPTVPSSIGPVNVRVVELVLGVDL